MVFPKHHEGTGNVGAYEQLARRRYVTVNCTPTRFTLMHTSRACIMLLVHQPSLASYHTNIAVHYVSALLQNGKKFAVSVSTFLPSDTSVFDGLVMLKQHIDMTEGEKKEWSKEGGRRFGGVAVGTAAKNVGIATVEITRTENINQTANLPTAASQHLKSLASSR